MNFQFAMFPQAVFPAVGVAFFGRSDSFDLGSCEIRNQLAGTSRTEHSQAFVNNRAQRQDAAVVYKPVAAPIALRDLDICDLTGT